MRLPGHLGPVHTRRHSGPVWRDRTTALVADALGRHGISVDMSADYLRIAQWRTTDPRQRAKAAQRDYTPPPQQLPGQVAFTF